MHSEEFKDCVALQAQYIYDTFGKFPATVPSIFVITYLQAHHLDLEFYRPGAYLETHATWNCGTAGNPNERGSRGGCLGGRAAGVGPTRPGVAGHVHDPGDPRRDESRDA